MLYIGVDLGTSAVKLLLMDESGKVLNIVSKEYPISFPKERCCGNQLRRSDAWTCCIG